MARWVGVDVGGQRKGFDAAVIDDRGVLELRGGLTCQRVFPTASWTRWFGKRGSRSRATWTRQGLTALGLEGIPVRTNQDQRDAIAAAMTARQHSAGMTEAIGDIVVPLAPLSG